MLAPQDPPTNATTPGSSSDALIHSPSISRAPQDPDYQIDDSSRASALLASSPQYIDRYSVPSTHIVDSPYRTPSVRHPHAKSGEYSPSVNHPHAYSPSLASPRVSSSYIPPPSPPPSQSNAYPAPEGHRGKIEYPDADGTYNQHHQQFTYQDTYQQTYQQRYPEPTPHAYPEPTLVDTFGEKIDQASVVKPANGRRKKVIWIGIVVILVLIGAIVGLVVTMKNKNSGGEGNNGNYLNSGDSASRTPTTPRPTSTASRTSIPVGTSTSSTPVTVPNSSIPVIVPTAKPSSGTGGSSGGGGGGRVTAPPLPSLPAPGQCPFTFCGDYYNNCRYNVCSQDSEYQECINRCNGDEFCKMDCLTSTACQNTCDSNLDKCWSHCG
ncbi:hypothetical protein BGW39_002227 [Mortierella sp. 14UC]|nr:hypothetical protein BGW39_002227 [Mortierella sp. 14UC]